MEHAIIALLIDLDPGCLEASSIGFGFIAQDIILGGDDVVAST
jgi:hypothetical protein